MRGVAKCALLAIVIVVGALVPALGQTPPNGGRVPPVVTHTTTLPPLGWYIIGSIGCAAVSPMIGTVLLGRELTIGEAYHTTLGCVLGPIGWLLADALFPPGSTGPNVQPGTPPGKPKRIARGRHINIP